ncbi:hypothetical protein [Actinomycetospora sp. NBRC 106378]|uniref:hypothetical protein n=1 Tax=Actinomycetospora sp. NBRC 106378 TaxID=3032208 RepID=UPI0024A315CF|nr:hypothetical protein [Actinomycetospora sp. NBRC 106378]GLZ52082.1 hypothetical protein Acsp07_16990 [Actinomycetospora sp. NBRC 106378]
MNDRARTTPSRGPAVVMAVGLGWIGGHFAGPGLLPDQLLVAAVHLLPVALVLLAVADLGVIGRTRRGAVLLTGVAVAIKVATVLAVIITIADPTGFGPHSVADWIPIGLANAGGGLWLREVLIGRRQALA